LAYFGVVGAVGLFYFSLILISVAKYWAPYITRVHVLRCHNRCASSSRSVKAVQMEPVRL